MEYNVSRNTSKKRVHF